MCRVEKNCILYNRLENMLSGVKLHTLQSTRKYVEWSKIAYFTIDSKMCRVEKNCILYNRLENMLSGVKLHTLQSTRKYVEWSKIHTLQSTRKYVEWSKIAYFTIDSKIC